MEHAFIIYKITVKQLNIQHNNIYFLFPIIKNNNRYLLVTNPLQYLLNYSFETINLILLLNFRS